MSKILLIAPLLTLLTFSSSALAQTYGTLMVVKGEVKVLSAKTKATGSAKVGLKVFEGDEILAGTDGRAKIVMSDRNVLNISPNSKIKISKYENDGQARNVEIQVDYGKVRASVQQKYDGEKNKFNIKTPTAVAGVRGTDFLTSYNRASRSATFITFEGSVAVGSLGAGGAILNPVYVNPGQQTEAKAGAAPEAPQPVPPETMKQLNETSVADSQEVSSTNPGASSSETKETTSEVKEEAKEVKAELKEEPKTEKKESARQPSSTPNVSPSPGGLVDARDLRPDAGLPSAGSDGGFKPPPPPVNFNPSRDIASPRPPGGNQFVNDAITNGPADIFIKINPK